MKKESTKNHVPAAKVAQPGRMPSRPPASPSTPKARMGGGKAPHNNDRVSDAHQAAGDRVTHEHRDGSRGNHDGTGNFSNKH